MSASWAITALSLERMAKRKRADEAVDTSNKFEALYNRKKFDVVGKKVKGSSGKRSTSRSTGAEKVNYDTCSCSRQLTRHIPADTAAVLLQRRNTLLVELKQSQRANSFIDRRIGGGHAPLNATELGSQAWRAAERVFVNRK